MGGICLIPHDSQANSPRHFAFRNSLNKMKRAELLEVISKYMLVVLSNEGKRLEIERLAATYIREGIIPPSKLEDALHIALATVRVMDILLSGNYKHLANINKEARVCAVNLLEGYSKPLRVVTLLEVVYMATKVRESKAQTEVWKWKAQAWAEVRHLDVKSAIRKRLKDAASTAKRLQSKRAEPTTTKQCSRAGGRQRLNLEQTKETNTQRF